MWSRSISTLWVQTILGVNAGVVGPAHASGRGSDRCRRLLATMVQEPAHSSDTVGMLQQPLAQACLILRYFPCASVLSARAGESAC